MLSLPGFCLQVRITHSRTTSRICMPKNCHNYKTCACLSMVSAFDVYMHTCMYTHFLQLTFFISAIHISMVNDMVLVCCYNHIHVHLTTLMFKEKDEH